MTASRTSSLPSILQQHVNRSDSSTFSHQDLQPFPNWSKERPQKSQAKTLPNRKLTSRDSARKMRDEQRLELVADLWDQVRAEIHQERHQLLSQKVLLQRALIAAQDHRSEFIRHREEIARLKTQDKKKKRRQEILVALQDTCRQSLVLDHKTKHRQSHNVANSSSEVKAIMETETAKGSSTIGRVECGKHGHVSLSSPTINDEAEALDAEPEAQLGKLYGHVAATPKLRTHRSIEPDLTSQPGHLSASQIWALLWSSSIENLLLTDQKFSQDLKETFSAHVREGITKFRRPVQRSFTKTEDVPDMDSLMNRSKQHQTRVLKHSSQLMYRSSQANQNRANILLYNNPLPSVSQEDGGIARFLPSLPDVGSVTSEAPYLRQIHVKDSSGSLAGSERGDNEENVPLPPSVEQRSKQPLSAHSLVTTNVSQSLQDVWTTAHRPRGEPKYHFLTEKEAETKGNFLAKLKTKSDFIPQQHGHRDTLSCKTAINKESSLKQSIAGSPQTQGLDSGSASTQISHLMSPWQPLSLHALSEYKQHLTGDGQGEFLQGRPSMWHCLASSH